MRLNILSMALAITVSIVLLKIPMNSHFEEKDFVNKVTYKALKKMRFDEDYMLNILERKGYAGVDSNQSKVLLLLSKRIGNLGVYTYNNYRQDFDIAKGYLKSAEEANAKLIYYQKCTDIDMSFLTSIIENESKEMNYLSAYTINYFKKDSSELLSKMDCSK